MVTGVKITKHFLWHLGEEIIHRSNTRKDEWIVVIAWQIGVHGLPFSSLVSFLSFSFSFFLFSVLFSLVLILFIFLLFSLPLPLLLLPPSFFQRWANGSLSEEPVHSSIKGIFPDRWTSPSSRWKDGTWPLVDLLPHDILSPTSDG